MIDSDYFAYACIDDTFAQAFQKERLSRPCTLRFYDTKISTITYLVKIKIKIADNIHQENVPMFVTPGLHYNIILRMPWLKRYQLKIE